MPDGQIRETEISVSPEDLSEFSDFGMHCYDFFSARNYGTAKAFAALAFAFAVVNFDKIGDNDEAFGINSEQSAVAAEAFWKMMCIGTINSSPMQ